MGRHSERGGAAPGYHQPRLNDLLNGRINKFGLDALVNLTGPAHFHVELTLEDEEAALA